jgi:oligoendopeptidase F
MSTTELQTVAWDLEDLVHGDGPEGSDRLLDEATERAEAFRARHAGKVAELDAPGLAGAMQELAVIVDLVGPRGQLRGAAVLDGHGVARERRADGERAGAVHPHRDPAALLRARVGGAGRRARRRAARGDDLDTVRHHLASVRRYRPHLLSEPEERIMAEKSQTARRRGPGCSAS